MRIHAQRGITLVEMLLVIAIIGMVIFSIVAVTMQAGKLHARTSVHLEPQASAMLALKRMQRELRDAMLISTTTPSPSTWIEFTVPAKDEHGLNRVQTDKHGFLSLVPGKNLCYFLGTKIVADPQGRNRWTARPDRQGTTLFRAETSYDERNDMFYNAQVLVDKVVNPYTLSATEMAGLKLTALNRTLFVFVPYDDSGTPDDISDDTPRADTQLITITLVVEATLQGKPLYHPLWTQFCMRNLKT